jgi:hypothetical protein
MVFRSSIQVERLIALAILLAIAAVLVSPAVPSAPTLLPAGTLLLLGLTFLCFHALMRAGWPLRTLLHSAPRTATGASLELVSTGLPLRR